MFPTFWKVSLCQRMDPQDRQIALRSTLHLPSDRSTHGRTPCPYASTVFKPHDSGDLGLRTGVQKPGRAFASLAGSLMVGGVRKAPLARSLRRSLSFALCPPKRTVTSSSTSWAGLEPSNLTHDLGLWGSRFWDQHQIKDYFGLRMSWVSEC